MSSSSASLARGALAVLRLGRNSSASLCSRGNNVRLLRRAPERHGGVELAREMVSTTHAKKLVWRDVDSEESYDLPAVKQLDKQDEELSVTGMALDYLVSMGEIKRLLLRIRIYIYRPTARWSFGGVAAHEQGEDDPVEGRCSLATSFAYGKFLIADGFTLVGCTFGTVRPSVRLTRTWFSPIRLASQALSVVGLPDVAMPRSFRLKYLGIIVGSIFTCILLECLAVLGPVRTYFRNKHQIPMRKYM
uniref:Uncharacterized protein n=1 Tax=Phytophthora ramorum TaxID=164328 RepID=H3GZW1_PHYRM